MDINSGDHEDQDLLFIEQSYDSLKSDLPTQLEYLKTQIDECLSNNDPNDIRHAILQEFDYQKQYQKQLFNLVQVLLKSAKHYAERITLLNEDLHESQKLSVQYHTQNESLVEEMKSFDQRIKNLERELDQSERMNDNIKAENNQIKSDLQNAKKEQQKLQKVADRFNKSRQSQSETALLEKNNLDVKIKELEDQLEEKDEEIMKLHSKYEQLDNERFKLERQLQTLNNDLEHMQLQREDEEQELNKMLDDKSIIIENLKSQLVQKDMEIKKYMIQESTMKAQEQFQNIGDLILRQQVTPKGGQFNITMEEQIINDQHLGSSGQRRQSRRSVEIEYTVEEDQNLTEQANLGERKKEGSVGQRQPRQKFNFNEGNNSGSIQKCNQEVQTNELELYNHDLDEFDGDYEQVDMSEIHRSQMKNKNVTMSLITETQTERKDPEEEYFRLTVLSVKMIHNERDSEFVVDVNPMKLYLQAQHEDIPFHFWFYWVDKCITEISRSQKPLNANNGLLAKLKNIFTRKNSYHGDNPFLAE